jgi:hypothetical protein
MCDCWIGILNDYDQSDLNNLYLSDMKEKLIERALHSVAMANFSASFKSFQPKDYIDRRKGLATLFNFCPLCGSKINWKGIRGGFKE